MKTYYFTLLSLILSMALCQSQVLEGNDFNALTVGNVNTNFDFSAAGQAGYFTFADNGDQTAGSTSTNAGNSNFQIVTNGQNSSQGLQITGPDGSDGFRQIQQLPYTWSSRTTGNDIIEAQFSFNTGANNMSENVFRWLLRSDDGTTIRTMIGVEFDSSTGELGGLATLLNGANEGFFGFDIGTGNTALILPANTWVTVGMSYDTADGRLRWKTDFTSSDRSFTNAANLIANQMPDDFIIVGFEGAATNAVAKTIVIDNVEVRAVATDMLLNLEDSDSVTTFDLFPNPTRESFKISTNGSDLASAIAVFDMSGKQVLSQKINSTTQTVDSSSLKAGIYVIRVSTNSGKEKALKLIIK